MFGYVIANKEALTEAETARYKAVYCGLCRALRTRHGQLGRLTLNYDMSFLILVLGSLCEPEPSGGQERCIAHPCLAHAWVSSEITDYAADMNVALAYLNLLDNWRDDRNLVSLALAGLLKSRFGRVKARYPRQCGAMARCIDGLAELEAAAVQDPDAGAKHFGELMSELFVLREDRWSNCLRSMAFYLGGFIYLLDAVIDLPRDIKKKRYNPLTDMKNAGRDEQYFKDILIMLIGNCTMAFEKLPLVEDVSIMRNILYSGVWTRYELALAKQTKRKGERPDDDRPL
ncbi:MAG: DUF5685 family protein [Oscillospiraceae bacterium]|jgi:hypothetical protein|nr:DUF5685 family protein [Oscillospiraceae bacterium]